MSGRRTSFIDPLPGSFVAIDFETADHGSDSACAIGMVRIEDGRVTRRVRQFFRPPRDIMMFTHIHGITMDYLWDKPTFGQAWPVLREVIDGVDFLAAHNAGFDRGVLHACLDRDGLDRPLHPWVCTVRQARKALGIFPANLDNVARVMGINLNHHDALSDAEACARIVLASQRVANEIRATQR